MPPFPANSTQPSPSQNLVVGLRPIAEIIRENFLVVPTFQRSYAWGEDVAQLLRDIEENLDPEQGEHFIGTVFTSANGAAASDGAPRLQVIDGQQRLATLTIMLAAARNKCVRMGDNSSSDIAQSLAPYLFYLDVGDKRRQPTRHPKLQMGQQDNQFFRDRFIDGNPSVAPKYESHRRLAEAYRVVCESLDEMSDDQIRNWIGFVEKSIKVIHVQAAQAAGAYAIFETINDRGVQLAQTDLIKTHLFKLSDEKRLGEVQESWASVVDRMETATKNEADVLLFFRHYWSSIHGLTRERGRELYRAIQKQVRNAGHVRELVRELASNVHLYAEIVRPEKRFWRDYSRNDDQAYNHVDTLESFGVDRYRPLLLSAVRNWGDGERGREIDALLRFLVAWLARSLIVGQISSGTMEKAYCDCAMKIERNEIESFAHLRKQIQSQGLVLSDGAFEKQLLFASISKPRLARYFLATLEEVLQGGDDPELLVNSNPSQVNLEHILPKKADDSWDMFSDEQKSELIDRIGNLTLLRAKLNSTLKNGPYCDKRAEYGESRLLITRQIHDEYPEWNAENLEDRQKKLAALAARAWKVNGE